jgi:glutamine synthetase
MVSSDLSSPSIASVEDAYTKALLRTLQFSGVQFLRYVTVDPYNTIRAKAIPIPHLLKRGKNKLLTLHQQTSIAAVCNGGLPSYADLMVEETGLSTCNVLSIHADPASLRILPYAKKTAVVMGNFHDQYSDEVSPYCTRSLLSKVVQNATEEHNIAFNVGAELEFCLVDAKTKKYVDQSIFANTTTLNEQEDFISSVYEHCQQQDLPIELIHAESAGGQLEVVLEYSANPVELCDVIVLTQETIKAVAHQFGYKALFLPKFDMARAGNGLHLHLSIRDATTAQPIFSEGNALSEKGSSFVEGILEHLPAITGLTLPTVNSHRRIGKGCWTGSAVGWTLEDKETSIRVCSNLQTKEWDHVECKLVDSTANPYLAVGALLQSGLSGIVHKATLRPSMHEDAPTSSQHLPDTLGEALDALEADSFITKTFLGDKLTKAYLAVRRHELERSFKMKLDEEVEEALA